ncbi:MAG: sigma-54 interaction domain-containing protein [Flavobacterium sp.]
MERKQSEIDALLQSIKEREKEQFELLSLSRTLAPIVQLSDFEVFVKNQLKNRLQFDHLVICATDAAEKDYQVIFHSDQSVFSTITQEIFLVHDGFFNTVLESPELVKFKSLDYKKNNIPSFIATGFASGVKEIIAFSLQFQKNNPSVLFLFYKNPALFDRDSYRFLKSINSQLSITVTNIIVRNRQNNTLSIATKPETVTQVSPEKPAMVATGIVGKSEATQKINNLINIVAKSASSVLISGESGTGKELVAQKIHQLSACKNKKMIVVNCAAIPENLIESELFGHEKGSFTDATERRIGKFEMAHKSTLFLDEIGELPLELQTKLLRVLQEKEIERIGGKKSIKVSVRIIAATNRDLLTEVNEKRFRADLFYRLNVFPIVIPPLRSRKEDIPELAAHFLSKLASKYQTPLAVLSANAIATLSSHPWPGNIRELEHCVERSLLLSDGKRITKIELSLAQTGSSNSSPIEGFKIKSLKEVEKDYILQIVKMCNGRISGPNGAAAKLQIPSTTLISKMQKLGIKKEHFLGDSAPEL